jgi:FtsZ-binding cell division protein ZapB
VTLQKVAYHGFARRLLAIDADRLLHLRELRDRGISEIPAIPSICPRPDELGVTELSEVVRALSKTPRGKPEAGDRQKERRVEIINVRSIQKPVRTRFLPAVLLQFERAGSLRERIVTFAVDGVEDESLERAFELCSGQDRIPELLKAEYQSTVDVAHEHLLPKQVERLGTLDDVDELVNQLTSAEGEIELKASALEKTEAPDTRQLLQPEIERLKAEKAELDRKVNSRKGRKLRTYDCKQVLWDSLVNAKERLVIVSAFISKSVIDTKFLVALEDALKRGVSLWIVYGLHDENKIHRYEWQDAAKDLSNLQKRFKDRFRLLDHGQVHSKWLICDSDFVAVGSFNWLSFRGDKGRGFRHEHALLVTEPETIEEWFDETRNLFPQSTIRENEKVEKSQRPVESEQRPIECFYDYDLLRRFDTGGMAEAFQARNRETGEIVFLKRVLRSSTDKEALERELRIYERLMRRNTQHVLRVLDFVRDDEQFVAFVTEYADGGDLESYVGNFKNAGGVPVGKAKEIGLSVAEAIKELHSHDVVHRDLKPRNVLLMKNAWKVADFGISKNRDRIMTQKTFQGAGTLGYAAPEQFQGVEARPSADLYSLGKILIFLLTGQTDVDYVRFTSWRDVIMPCIRIAPSQRPTIEEVIKALQALVT